MPSALFVFGTRPEAIKTLPLILELKKRGKINTKIALTGQHRELMGDILSRFGIYPDCDLGVMHIGQSLSDSAAAILSGLDGVLRSSMPDIVLVQGDTVSALGGALAAFHERIPVAHIEAGLRSFERFSPFPEEAYRRIITRLASLHFAPTAFAAGNLAREGVTEVYTVGNTVVDALRLTEGMGRAETVKMGDRRILLTTHRRENLGEGQRAIWRAVRRAARAFPDLEIIYPVHPNTSREQALRIFSDTPTVRLTEPMSVFDFHAYLRTSYAVLTDSGGVAEEAAALGVPTLILRNNTERQECIACGSARLASTDEEKIFASIALLCERGELINKMKKSECPFGDGRAAVRIADVLETGLCGSR